MPGSAKRFRNTSGVEEIKQDMTKEEEILAALDKPRALFSIQQRINPGGKSTDALQDMLMKMRTEGKVKFDIKTGHWSKA
jgi:hypothetical protein